MQATSRPAEHAASTHAPPQALLEQIMAQTRIEPEHDEHRMQGTYLR